MGWWTESRYDSVCPRSGHLAYAGSLAHERIRSPDAALGDRLVAARPVPPCFGGRSRAATPSARVAGTLGMAGRWHAKESGRLTLRSATDWSQRDQSYLIWWMESRCDSFCPRSGHLGYGLSLAHERIRSPDAALGNRLVAARPVPPCFGGRSRAATLPVRFSLNKLAKTPVKPMIIHFNPPLFSTALSPLSLTV